MKRVPLAIREWSGKCDCCFAVRPSDTKKFRAVLVLALVVGTFGQAAAFGADEFGARQSWTVPQPAEVEAQLIPWLTEQQADEAIRVQALKAFRGESAPKPGYETLDRLVAAVAVVDEQARKLQEQCSAGWKPGALPDSGWLDDPARPAWLQTNLRLYLGRWMAQEKLFDEALLVLGPLRPEQVVDPASLLFYQAVGYHRLLDREAGVQALDRLLEREAELPERYRALARLMREDLAALEDETLDHISRRMDDIKRRLELGRAGEKVIEIEKGVIESLDKLIKQAEQQQQQQMAQMSQGGGGRNPQGARGSQPAPDSMPLGGKGPGEVTKKDVGNGSGWGNLDPRQREEALQQIGKDFPAHYREAIEQYFRNLAAQEEAAPR